MMRGDSRSVIVEYYAILGEQRGTSRETVLTSAGRAACTADCRSVGSALADHFRHWLFFWSASASPTTLPYPGSFSACTCPGGRPATSWVRSAEWGIGVAARCPACPSPGAGKKTRRPALDYNRILV